MSEFMKWLWQINLEISLLLIFILLARAALRRLARSYNNYLLWFSIPLALLVAVIMANVEFSSPIAAQVQPIRTVLQESVLQSYVHGYIVQPVERFDTWSLFGLIVAALVVLLLMRLASQHWGLRQELKRVDSGRHAQISSSFPVVAVNKEGFSPAVYGFLKPKIYFPLELKTSLSESQIELIIQHEEQHIKQGHLWLNLLWDMLVCVLWFNPLVYFSRQCFRHDQELYCDYLVLKNSDLHDRRNYGHALLSTVSATHSVSLLCSWKMFNQLEERIMNIKSTFNSQKKLSIAFISILVVCATSMYSLAMAGGSAKEEARIEADRIVVGVGKDANRSIKIVKDDVTYIEENGELFIETDGERRPMPADERAEYARLVKVVEVEGATDVEVDGKVPASDRVKSLASLSETLDDAALAEVLKALEESKNLEDFRVITKLEGLEGLERLEALVEHDHLSGVDIRIIDGFGSPFVTTEHDLEQALRSIEQAKIQGNTSKAQLKRAAKELEALQKELVKRQELMEKTRKKARSAAKKIRDQIQRDAV